MASGGFRWTGLNCHEATDRQQGPVWDPIARLLVFPPFAMISSPPGSRQRGVQKCCEWVSFTDQGERGAPTECENGEGGNHFWKDGETWVRNLSGPRRLLREALGTARAAVPKPGTY
jgi:hypothetical protein